LLADPDISRVRSVARRPLPTHPKLQHVRADLRDPAARRALERVDVLWHLGFQLWRRAGRSRMEGTNVEGTAGVAAARPGRIVVASSAAVYGAWPDNPLPIDESVTPRPNAECDYARQKLRAEEICAASAPTSSLRISGVVGPTADPVVRRLAATSRRLVPAVRGVRQALQFLHEEDAVAALHLAGKRGAAGVYNVAPPDWMDERAYAAIAGARVVHVRPRVLLRASEVAFHLHLTDVGADRAVLITGPLALAPGRARQVLGWRASRSSRDTLSEFLAGLGAPRQSSER
jgi:nucleoside-diphosphate-sugar epimerase